MYRDLLTTVNKYLLPYSKLYDHDAIVSKRILVTGVLRIQNSYHYTNFNSNKNKNKPTQLVTMS